jgi:hypothetical protein
MTRRHRNWAFDVVANATESLYSMINLDGVQECRPLHLTHPTPCHGPFNRRRWQSARSSVSPQDRNLWRVGAMTKVTAGKCQIAGLDES